MSNITLKTSRNSKLEAFLKRNLKTATYGDIRWYEPVVIRRGNSMSYRNIIVTGDEIFSVNNQLKETLPLLRISDITAVILVHDLPEFLEGGLRDRTTHILLKVRRFADVDSRQGSLSSADDRAPENMSFRKSSDSTTSRLESSESLPGVLKVAVESQNSRKDFQKSLQQMPLFQRRYSADVNNIISAENSNKNYRRRSSLKPILKNCSSLMKYVFNWRDCSDNISNQKNADNRNFERRTTCPDIIESDSSNEASRCVSPALFDVLQRMESKQNLTKSKSSRDISEKSTDIRNSCAEIRMEKRNSCAEIRAPPYLRSQSVVKTTLNAKKLHPPAMRSWSAMDQPINFYSDLFSKKNSIASKLGASETFTFNQEIHVYTLSTNAHLYHLLHSMWMESLLTQEADKYLATIDQIVQMSDESIEETLLCLFNDLKKATLPQEYLSILEDLKNGIRKYPSVRRLFWKDKEYIENIINIVKNHQEGSNGQSLYVQHFNDENTERRKQEIEVTIMGFGVIETVLARSQGCPYKNKILRSTDLCTKLGEISFSLPHLEINQKLICKQLLTDIKELFDSSWQVLPERELLRLVQTSVLSSIGIAYQLIESLFEQGWSQSSKNIDEKTEICQIKTESNTIHFLFKTIHTEVWMSYMIPQLLYLVQPKNRSLSVICEEEVIRDDMILIYQSMAILLAVLKQSPKALSYCITNYSEEIRYFMAVSNLKRRLDTSDPLTPHTLRFANSICKLVLR